MEPTQEQIEEFWEWCGLRYECYDTPAMPHQGGAWLDTSGKLANEDEPCELPPIDLNNLFKYAVPKLDQSRYYHALKSIFLKQDNPTLALFWALWEVSK